MLELYYKIGFSVCHQMAERSIFIDGLKMPVDARETGIFVGFLVTLIFLLIRTPKANDLPSKGVSLIFGISVFFLIFDGLTSYLHMRPTNNFIRLFTGLPVGSYMSLLLLPTYNESKNINTSSRVLESRNDKLILTGLLLLSYIIILARFTFLKYILPPFIIAGIISAFTLLNLTIISLVTKNKIAIWGLSLLLTTIELTVTFQLHMWAKNLSVVT